MELLFWLMFLMIFPDHGSSDVADMVSAIEGESVILETRVEKIQQDKIRFYFNNTLIAQVNGDISKTCTDVQCNKDNENFRDRLKLDHQTGSLTIMNIRNTDAGDYQLKFYSKHNTSEKAFRVTVHGSSSSLAASICVTFLLVSAWFAVIS